MNKKKKGEIYLQAQIDGQSKRLWANVLRESDSKARVVSISSGGRERVGYFSRQVPPGQENKNCNHPGQLWRAGEFHLW